MRPSTIKNFARYNGYGKAVRCKTCGRTGIRGVDFGVSHYDKDNKVQWRGRCYACHTLAAKSAQGLGDMPEDVVSDLPVTFLHDPSGNFKGNKMPALTFVKTLRMGYWDEGLVIKYGNRRYRVVGAPLSPQRLEEVTKC